ncbi:hypothetical protein AAGG74_14500 [Bacillus mexicanus]|uniref:hypothetical protein n=1 Tax=Bacillus mexicanus TaxID=2834415 RepID=UPI003D1D5E96
MAVCTVEVIANEKYIGDEIIEGKEILTQSVFKDIEQRFRDHKFVEIKEYIDVKNEIAMITYVGPRFANVKLKNGYQVSINYGGILDNQNQKEEIVSRIRFV